MSNLGKIYWIGTGPGDPGLMTVKGLALVQEADAVVGNALAHARLLQQARSDAEIHDVGSRSAGNKMAPDRVEQLLLELGQQAKTVVRLWPGDPFVFGRAAEEMVKARQAGIAVELVPGVTSAIAAPALAGVPLTHWDYAASFAVVAGFIPPNSPAAPNWDALARIETLVILMPLENLGAIVDKLTGAGMAANTPALAVQLGTTVQQKQATATLGSLVQTIQARALSEPTVVVLGQVVQLAGQLDWFQPDNLPLLGKRVLVTRPLHQAPDFMASLRNLGAEPVAFPTIEIRPVENSEPLDAALRRLAGWILEQRGVLSPEADAAQPYHWLVLTSANGVTAVWDRLHALGLDSRCLASVKVAAIGSATAAALAQRSISPDLVPEEFTAEGILDEFDRLGSVAGRRFLLARADIARKTLATGLTARGAVVDEIAAYRTVPVEAGPPPPPVDIVTFTSSSTVQGYVNCLGSNSPAAALANSQVVCIGPITAATAQTLGVPVHAVAEEYTINGILDTLLQGGIK